MTLITLAVSGYRSLRDLVVPLGPLTVVTGANGTGKSSLYRSLKLLADVAQGDAIASLAREGGLGSTMWAGGRHYSQAMKRGLASPGGRVGSGPVSLKLGFASSDYGYAIDLGLPVPGPGVSRLEASLFDNDPVVKTEALWAGESLSRRNLIAERRSACVSLRGEDGAFRTPLTDLAPFETMMTHAADPAGAPELLALRERMRRWRFYDHFRIDREAPARRPQIGTRTLALASDGADVAAAIQTIREIGDGPALERAIADAFPGARIAIAVSDGLFMLSMEQEGLGRPLAIAELSDGTLRYVLLATALHTPRPPPLMVLNEPENSLHPRLLAPLARMIAAASRRSQVMVVTHARELADALEAEGAHPFALSKLEGETVVEGTDPPPWLWPKR